MTEKPTYKELEKRIQDFEQAKSESKLAEKKLVFHLQNTPVGAISWDLDFKTIEWNPAAETIFGYSKEEAIGKHAAELIVNVDMRELIDGIFQKLIFEKGGTRSTNENITKDGRQIICDWYNTTLKDADDNIIGVASLVNDITESVKMLNAFKKQKEFSEKIIQTSSAIIVGLDKDHRVKIFNRGAEKITGFQSKEVLGKDWFKIFFKSDVYDEMDSVWKDAWGIDFHSYINPIRAKNGAVKIISWQTTGMYEDENEQILISIGEDITKRKQIEDEIKYSKLQFEAVFNNLHSSIYIADMKTYEILFMNQNMKDEFGKDLTGQICWKAIHKNQEGPCGFCTNDKLIDADGISKAPYVWEYYNQRLQQWYELRDQAIPWLDGRLVRMEIATDITDRKNTEEALRESEEKYRSMMESMKDSAYICSSEFRIEYMNVTMIDRVGQDATGEICHKAIYDQDTKCSWCVFDQIKQKEYVDYEVADPRNNNYYSVSNSPISHSNGSISKLTIFRDITELKTIEENLRQAQKMESVGTLAGGIAHDFNNLLYMIVGNTELALEDISKFHPVHSNLKEIKSAGLRAAGIVKQLLDFSRKTDEKLSPLDAVTIIKDSLKFLRSTIPSTVKIREHLPDDEIVIHADPTQINQIMMNLCINASQSMEEAGGILTVKIEKTFQDKNCAKHYPEIKTGHYLKVIVSDTGPGIEPEIIDRIFDPYFTTKDVGKGTGMGLAVVLGIVKNHNGAVRIDSPPGKGASFTMLFPVVAKKPEFVENAAPELLHGTETILFVDDEKPIVNMIQKVLERLGYMVETSINPEEALASFTSKPDSFDMVITDMTMPQMTGAKLSEKLMKIRSDIPVIICTGHSSLIDEDRAKELGIAGFVMKPVSISTIAKTIRKVLDK